MTITQKEIRINLKTVSRLFCIALLFALLLWGCGADNDYPENIILFIGDGMGVTHITAGKIARGNINLERFSNMGLVTTHSANHLVTESAAAATALATGYKTNNRALSVSVEREPLKTLFEYANEQGKSVGVVVTSSVTDATPAAFMAHADDRSQQADIAEQIAYSGIDVLIGGGWAYFVPATDIGSKRKDQKDLLAALETRMPVILADDKLSVSVHSENHNLAALLSPGGLPKAADRDYSLTQLTRKAIYLLSKNRNGFVLMVEGSQIDRAAHNHARQDLIAELIDFDDAVGAGFDFAEKNRATLIVVAADHETGGLAVHDGSVQKRQVTATAFTTTGHTAAMVPLFAYGPGSARFSGIQDNARVGRTLIDLLLQR
ncbi:MAG: alkaline phosphatase [Deltaproteobacteria bacterium]|jgi:alkaline phosphatase